MKRQYSIENPSLFSKLPLELLYKIQYLLNAVSLVYLRSTCKYLYETRTYNENLKQEEIYTKCLSRVISYLEKRDLLTLVQNFLHQFDSVIRGNLLNEYLYSPIGTHTLLISIPDHISFPAVLTYLKENITDLDVYDDMNMITISTKKLDATLLLFLHNVETLERYGEERVPQLDINMSLDFQKLYCENFLYLLKSKEDLEDKFNPTLKE